LLPLGLNNILGQEARELFNGVDFPANRTGSPHNSKLRDFWSHLFDHFDEFLKHPVRQFCFIKVDPETQVTMLLREKGCFCSHPLNDPIFIGEKTA
jgi:hypothetical protein